MSKQPNFDLTQIFKEEAAKMGITLGPEDSTKIHVAPGATEAQARERAREILKAKKPKK